MRLTALTCSLVASASTLLAASGCKPPPSVPVAAPVAGQPSGAAAAPAAGYAAAPSAAAAKPAVPEPPIKRPLTLSRPAVPQFGSEGVDTSKMYVDQLMSSARVSAAQDKPRLAADLFRLAIERGADGLYEMAIYEARAENVDRAFYWLQEAAMQEGVDPTRCDGDTTLEKLRADPRWMSVREFLTDCQDHWSKSNIDDHKLVLPASYQQVPLPLLIWLQPSGGCSTSHALFPQLQHLADTQGVACLSVSGPLITGPRHFSWPADMQACEARIAAALAKFGDKLKVKEDRLALAGAAEGGQIAGELAAAQPQRYCGALILFPRGFEILPANLAAAEAHKRQQVIIVTGADNESSQLGGGYHAKFSGFGAAVTFQPYTDVTSFAMIPDLQEKLPQWTGKVLGTGSGS